MPAASKGLGLSPEETATRRLPASSDAKRVRASSPRQTERPVTDGSPQPPPKGWGRSSSGAASPVFPRRPRPNGSRRRGRGPTLFRHGDSRHRAEAEATQAPAPTCVVQESRPRPLGGAWVSRPHAWRPFGGGSRSPPGGTHDEAPQRPGGFVALSHPCRARPRGGRPILEAGTGPRSHRGGRGPRRAGPNGREPVVRIAEIALIKV